MNSMGWEPATPLDVGPNVDYKLEVLYQYAVIEELYRLKAFWQKKEPLYLIANIRRGGERQPADQSRLRTDGTQRPLRFVGNIEAKAHFLGPHRRRRGM